MSFVTFLEPGLPKETSMHRMFPPFTAEKPDKMTLYVFSAGFSCRKMPKEA